MTDKTPADVFDAMHDLMHAYRHRMRAAMQTELTANEMRALMFVGRHPMRTQKELVQHSGADKAQIARMLGTLEEKGWLERLPHPRDARSRCLTLSRAGQAVFERMRERRRGITVQLLQGLSEDEQLLLQGLLERMLGDLAGA
ncbi:MarR family winged helix-turn-helix transcriptional regulator [Comamonas antarctica]|uniref:MarR family transcriptional regulator n=1 Tax=Comamonas antarctica TaxID=2743470 RepID=A0A6N1X772_9BURK|nr:MarR family transcriptional regulator [Comamonas antarctica]QKV54698.1 MarR family transcriptional regulator [Comamonas antarctica]